MKITVIGGSYVALTTSIALAYIGHNVQCVGQNTDNIVPLQNGKVQIYEYGVEEILDEVKERLSFETWNSFEEDADVIIIAVGSADLTSVQNVAMILGRFLPGERLPLIVNKSTASIGLLRGSVDMIETLMRYFLRARGINAPVMVASNPDFLREGRALFDTFYPHFIIAGASNCTAIDILREMYAPILEQEFTPPKFFPRPGMFELPAFITTTPANAERIKYAVKLGVK